MLTKTDIMACLAGEKTPIVPAYLFWFDGKFIEKNAAEVNRMHMLYGDNFLQRGPNFVKNATDPKLQMGEFTDTWGSLFRAVPDGVGAHPIRPIIHSANEWQDYMEGGIPTIDPTTFAADIRETVVANPDRYVVGQFWRTFCEPMYMLGFENLMVEIATGSELFSRMLTDLRDFIIRGIELIADAGADAAFWQMIGEHSTGSRCLPPCGGSTSNLRTPL